MSQQSNLPLPQYYAQTLNSLLPILDDTLPATEESTQTQLSKAIDDLYLISRMLTSLGVFSDNEEVDELGDRELVFMTTPFVLGEAETRGGLGGYKQRMGALKRSETAFNAFLGLLSTYKVLGDHPEASGSAGAAPQSADPAARRDAKIKAYRQQKEQREKISVSQQRPTQL